jgi:hypothetical protein
MNPLKITRKYPLPDEKFGRYSSQEIVDKIYLNVLNGGFKKVEKNGLHIKITGTIWVPDKIIDQISNDIDYGEMSLDDSSNPRSIIYCYSITRLWISTLVLTIILQTFLSFFLQSFDKALKFSIVLVLFMIIRTIFLIIFHPTIVSIPLEMLSAQKT